MTAQSTTSNQLDLSRRSVSWPEAAAVLLIIMEVSWIIPWYRSVIVISYVASPIRAFLVFTTIMGFAYVVTRAADNFRLRNGLRQVILAALFITSVLAASNLLLDPNNPPLFTKLFALDPGTVLVTLAAVWLWWRGISLARNMISPSTAWNRFTFGIMMLVLYLLVITRVTRTNPGVIPFLLFLISGLLALVVSRVAFINLFHGSAKNPFSRTWVATITLSVTGIVSLVALFVGLLTGQFSYILDQMTEVLRLLIAAVLFIASIPWLIITYLLFPILNMLKEALPPPLPTPTPTVIPAEVILTPAAAPMLVARGEPFIFPPILVSVIFWLLALFVIIAIFVRSGRVFHRSKKDSLGDTESILDKEQLLDELGKNARNQLSQLANLTRRLRPKEREQARAYIRKIYTELMDLMEAIGSPRPTGITPLEYQLTLDQVFPGFRSDLDLITQAYVRVRYGELPETEAEMDAIRGAWERVSVEGEKRKKEYRRLPVLEESEQDKYTK